MTGNPSYLGRAKAPAPKRANFIPSTPNYFKYQWLDRDPDMDLIVGILGESGLSPEDVENETARLGHKVSRWTVISWLYGSVRRPQNFTMTIVAMACGWTKTWAPVASEPISETKKSATLKKEKRSYVGN